MHDNAAFQDSDSIPAYFSIEGAHAPQVLVLGGSEEDAQRPAKRKAAGVQSRAGPAHARYNHYNHGHGFWVRTPVLIMAASWLHAV